MKIKKLFVKIIIITPIFMMEVHGLFYEAFLIASFSITMKMLIFS